MKNIKRTKPPDTFGMHLWDFYNKKAGHNCIIERDDNYVDVSDLNQYFQKFSEWLQTEKAAIKYARGKVLDVGCGAGRNSLYLQNKGHYVLGIDESPLVIKVAKSRGLKHTKVLKFEDAEKLKPSKFDTILMYGNNFGLFESFNKARKMLKMLDTITSPYANIIAAVLDPYTTNSPYHLSYHKLNNKRGRMRGQARIRIRYKNLIGQWFDYLLVSPDELKKILSGTNWKQKKKFTSKTHPIYTIILEKLN